MKQKFFNHSMPSLFQPTTSTSMENTCELESAELSGRLVAFQNLFLKKKNSEASRKKSSCERKSSLVSHLPSSILKVFTYFC